MELTFLVTGNTIGPKLKNSRLLFSFRGIVTSMSMLSETDQTLYDCSFKRENFYILSKRGSKNLLFCGTKRIGEIDEIFSEDYEIKIDVRLLK